MVRFRCSQVNRTAAALVNWFLEQSQNIQTVYYPNQPQPPRPVEVNISGGTSELLIGDEGGRMFEMGMKDAKAYHDVMRGRLPLEAVSTK